MIVTILNPARLLLANLFRQVLPFGLAISILGAGAIAQATMIATWTFETSQPATAGPFSPESVPAPPAAFTLVRPSIRVRRAMEARIRSIRTPGQRATIINSR